MAKDPEGRKTSTPNVRRRNTAALLLVVVLAVNFAVRSGDPADAPEKISLTEALTLVDDGKVQRATTSDQTFTLDLYAPSDGDDGGDAADGDAADGEELPTWTTTYSAGYTEKLVERLIDAGVEVESVPVARLGRVGTVISSLLPLLILMGFLFLLISRSSALSGVGKFKGKRGSEVEAPDTRFTDVAGCDEAIGELADVVDFLRNPDRYRSGGARMPRGYLLVGPPGTGKTLLARAVAGEAGVPFFAVSGSEFVEVFVGQGASRVRNLFDRARKHPAAIVFIDEIDAVGRSRVKGGAMGGANIESENTLNQLLTEMDGFGASNIIVLAATNRSDMLDPALTRAGRFDRTVSVPAPDRGGRLQLLQLYTEGKRLGADVDLTDLARRCVGMTGADIANLINRAALEAVKDGAEKIDAGHLQNALATLMLGRARTSALVTPRDRLITAWHEAGHAVAALLQVDAADPVAVSIIPRGPAGGVTWMAGGDHVMPTRKEMMARLVVSVAGRAGEMIGLDGEYTAGAHNDLKVATELAEHMVASYGMTDVGLMVFDPQRISVHQDRLDAAVNRLLGTALTAARSLLDEHRSLLAGVVEALLDLEDIGLADLKKLAADAGATLPDKQHLFEEPTAHRN
jgi:cell division protease FtsH